VTVTFTYDGNGQRVKKESSTGSATSYFGELYEIRNEINVMHVFAGNNRVASIRSDGKNQFYHGNHLGSASVITDQYRDWKERIEYFPFGSYREDVKNPSDPNFPDANYTFTDQEDDDELGFYNYGARLYDPILGRFISPDRIVQTPENPQSLNRYSYCLNNPLIYTDPSGEIFEWLVGAVMSFLGVTATEAGIVLIMAAGVGFGAVSSALTGGDVVVGAISGFMGGMVGFAAGNIAGAVLAPTVATKAASTIAGYVGAFAGGATSGAINAGVYGGNIWQGALYGGFFAVATLATIQGII
jgi:RHS repeat-associated protein